MTSSHSIDEERADVQDRIDLDIGAGVDAEEHHDPQYNGPGVSRQADHVELPLWVTLSAIGCVAVLVRSTELQYAAHQAALAGGEGQVYNCPRGYYVFLVRG